MQNSDSDISDEIHHRLWLVYCQLKDAETDGERRPILLEQSRIELGRILNAKTGHQNTRLAAKFSIAQK